MVGMSTTRSELALRGPLPSALRELIRTRFDQVSFSAVDRSVLIIESLDQASVRALLTLIWDAGHEVQSPTPLTQTSDSLLMLVVAGNGIGGYRLSLVTADLDTLLIALYVLIDDHVIASSRRGPGRPERLCDAELACLAVGVEVLLHRMMSAVASEGAAGVDRRGP